MARFEPENHVDVVVEGYARSPAALPLVVVGSAPYSDAYTERIASLFLAKTIYASLIAVVVSAMAVAYPFLPRQFTVVSSLTIGIPAFVLALAPSNQRYRQGF